MGEVTDVKNASDSFSRFLVLYKCACMKLVVINTSERWLKHPRQSTNCSCVIVINKSAFVYLNTLTKWRGLHRPLLLQQSIDISCWPGPQQQTCSSGFVAVRPWWDRQTERRTNQWMDGHLTVSETLLTRWYRPNKAVTQLTSLQSGRPSWCSGL